VNRRIHKKLCKRAMEKLIAKHGYKRHQFWFVGRRDEITCDAPTNMERWSRDRGVLRGRFMDFFTPLKGTPGVWSSIAETDDCDFISALTLLEDIETDWSGLWEPTAEERAAPGTCGAAYEDEETAAVPT
jgi:hypothetical protein